MTELPLGFSFIYLANYYQDLYNDLTHILRYFCNAERLWTSFDKLAKDPYNVMSRLAHFRCLLNQRGVQAAPLVGYGRQVPLEPGSCYKQ